MAENFDLEDQRPDEEIILTRHMHPWVLSKMGFVNILLVLVGVLVWLIWRGQLITFIIFAVLLIILFLFDMMRLFAYRNTLFILTNHRVINILQGGMFRREIQETELENIYNLVYKINGPIQSFLNFGDLELTTQGDDSNMIRVKDIENPHFVHEKISALRKKAINNRR